MNILLLCDEAGEQNRQVASDLAAWAHSRGDTLHTLYAADLAVKPCIGCFGCWTKTPGQCVIANDAALPVLKAWVAAELILTIGAIPYGSFALPLKRVFDRMLPALLPFFRTFRGEMHHVLRYARPPRLLHVSRGPATAAELATFRDLSLAHADNVGSPRPGTAFHFAGDTAALTTWITKEMSA